MKNLMQGAARQNVLVRMEVVILKSLLTIVIYQSLKRTFHRDHRVKYMRRHALTDSYFPA